MFITDPRLKRLFIYYFLSGLSLSLVLSGSIVLKKYSDSITALSRKLESVRTSLVKMSGTVSDMNNAISEIKTAIPHTFESMAPEALIFNELDRLKSRIKSDEIIVTSLVYKEDGVYLPVNIKGTLKSYTAFVNDIGYIQSLNFPFSRIDSILISRPPEKDKDKASVSYAIDGSFLTPQNKLIVPQGSEIAR